jgi:hypothetical protein
MRRAQLFAYAAGDAGINALQAALRRHERRQRAVLCLQIEELGVGDQRTVAVFHADRHAARQRVGQHDDFLRVADGQRAHQHTVDEAEDGGVGPNAERQREDGDRR